MRGVDGGGEGTKRKRGVCDNVSTIAAAFRGLGWQIDRTADLVALRQYLRISASVADDEAAT